MKALGVGRGLSLCCSRLLDGCGEGLYPLGSGGVDGEDGEAVAAAGNAENSPGSSLRRKSCGCKGTDDGVGVVDASAPDAAAGVN